MNDEPETGPGDSQPAPLLSGVVSETIRFVIRHKKIMLRVILIPYIAILGLSILTTKIETANFPESIQYALAQMVEISELIVITFMSTAWHRFTILTSYGHIGPTDFRFGKNEIRFFGYSLLLYLAYLPVTILQETAIIKYVNEGLYFLILLGSFALSIIVVRFDLVFPAAAIGDAFGLRDSFRLTKGYMWSLFGNTLLMGILLIFIYYLVSLGLSYVIEFNSFIFTLWRVFFTTGSVLVMVSLISFFYLRFQKLSAAPTQEQQP